MREGDFAPGGSFCPQRVLLPNPTSSFNQPPNHSTLPTQKHPPRTVPPSKSPTQPTIPDISALHRQNHPPNPAKTRKTQPSPPNPEGDSTPGGQFGKQKMFPAQENQPDITANFFTWKATPNPLSLTHRPPTNSSDPPPPPRTPRASSPDHVLFPLQKPRCNSSEDNNP